MPSPKGSKMKLKGKATGTKKPVSTKRGNDTGKVSGAKVAKVYAKSEGKRAKMAKLSKVKF